MDAETRVEVAEALKASCPLCTVLKPQKPCPYFGPSVSCRDCTFDWMSTAETVGKLAGARRASYEREREKKKEALAELAAMRPVVEKISDCFRAVSDWVESQEAREDECDAEGAKDG